MITTANTCANADQSAGARSPFFSPMRRAASKLTFDAPSVGLTLRAKGCIACVALLIYVLAVGAHVAYERGRLQQLFQEVDVVHDEHELLLRVNSELIHLIVSIQDLTEAKQARAYDDIERELTWFTADLSALKQRFPAIARTVEAVERRSAVLSHGGERPRDALIVLRDSAQDLAGQLVQIADEVEKQHASLSKAYGALNRYLTLFVMMGANVFGIGVFAVVVTLFLSRLGRDVKQLETRAMAIVDGYRGPPLDVVRRDEVGTLMQALNRMQSELRKREQQQEISRQQRFHQEKMAAVGSLAASVAHEVSNPISLISGIAQLALEALESQRRPEDETLRRNINLILKQTERIGLFMRQLADASAPRSPDPELIDINELVKSTCGFIRYDQRLRHVNIVFELNPDLPAVRIVADHLMQILLNLLINSGDALEGVTNRDQRTILVSTHRTENQVIVSVSDNGHGMDSTVLAHVFEDSFTTKPAGQRRGIGLYLCKILIEESGGRIEADSTLGVGTTVRIHLPLRT